MAASRVTQSRLAAVCLVLMGYAARGDGNSISNDEPLRLSRLLPVGLAEQLDINVWGWLSYLQTSAKDQNSYWDTDLAIGATERLGSRLAISADMHFYDADDAKRGFLEQAFASARLSDTTDALVTAGKFNAGIGLEPRDAWNRIGGTASLLFGAEPQDALGVMYTQPLGTSGVTVRPFLTNGFEGKFNFDRAPAIGAIVEYQPTHELTFAVTNWFGSGFRPSASDEDEEYDVRNDNAEPEDEDEDAEYRHSNYAYAYGNWVGTHIHGDRSGSLYFLDAHCTWMPRPDLTLGVEGLIAIDSAAGGVSWGGLMVLANYDLTDRFRVFGRASFLNDNDGLVTGTPDRMYELSAGVGYVVVSGTELRVEYRHDFSVGQDDLDAVSAHLTFAY